jgi:Xaa-Pro dipeptidase
MAPRGLDGLLVIGRSFYDRVGNLAYLSNHFPPFLSIAFTGSMRGAGHAAFLLTASGESTLVIDARAYRQDVVVADDVVGGNDMTVTLPDVLERKGLAKARLGLVGEDVIPLALYRAIVSRLPQIDLVGADDLLAGLRRIKTPAEQDLLRCAADVSGVGLRSAVESIVWGQTEHDVCAAGTGAALAAGADFVRYLRVHSGPWAGTGSRWPPATDRVLKEGDYVTLDIIGAYKGYHFDVLRSCVVGEAKADQRTLMDAALRATERVVDACRPGARVRDLFALGWRLLDEAGYGSYASNFIGHGIGLETVEEPLLMADVDMILEPGMVLCVEPSIRIPGQAGCSVEQELIVQDGPPEVITEFPARLW